MRDLAFIHRSFDQQKRLAKQRERIQELKKKKRERNIQIEKQEKETTEEILEQRGAEIKRSEEAIERAKSRVPYTGKWERRKAEWEVKK
ncbi:MAG: hypothetical protein ABIH28_03625 [archaeon]